MARRESVRETGKTSDFIRWENIPLDFFLGEFTEEECKSESSHDSENESIVAQPKPSAASKFQCPRCSKTYASISGFRGHVAKKHNEPQLKARDHRIGHPMTIEDNSPTSMRDTTSADCIAEVVNVAMRATAEDATFTKTPQEAIFMSIRQGVLECSETLGKLCGLLEPLIRSVQLSLRAGLLEQMWTVFHEVSTDDVLTKKLFDIISCCSKSALDIDLHMFTRCLLDCVVKAVLQREKKSLASDTDRAVCEVSENDQGVLYYISGNLLHAVLKKTMLTDTQVLIEAMCKSDSGEEVPSHISAWLKSKNRGGLKTPSLKFFKLVVMFECIVRKEVDLDKLDAMSLSTVRLKELILSDSTVQMMWQEITNFSGHQRLLENFISHFLTVRGFAVTKYIKKQEQKRSKFDENSRNSFSLRKKLKR